MQYSDCGGDAVLPQPEAVNGVVCCSACGHDDLVVGMSVCCYGGVRPDGNGGLEGHGCDPDWSTCDEFRLFCPSCGVDFEWGGMDIV